MRNDNYWRKLQEARITRRRLLAGGAALGAGAAGIAIVGCSSGSDNKNNTPSAGRTSTAGAGTNANDRQKDPVQTRGGIFRSYTFDALALDTFDPHQTQFGPIYNLHAAVFSRVLQYEDDVKQTMSPDLADGMPEQPDQQTYIVRIRKGIKFHDSPAARQNYPSVAGRELTAEDVKFSIERQTNPNTAQKALYYRRGQWETIDSMTLTDPYTLTIKTKGPVAPFLHYFADRNAHIVPHETVNANDIMPSDKEMIGTGPFFVDNFAATSVVKVRRNPTWFAKDDKKDSIGGDRPFIDGYDSLWTPMSDSAEEAALTSKQVDATGFEDDSNVPRVQNAHSDLELVEAGVGGWVNSRLWLSDRSPLKDFRLRQALHLAVDRRKLGESMFPTAQGRRAFLAVGPITYPMTLWALPQGDLERMPGYRTDTQGRAEDISNAKKMWDAANGPSSLPIIFAGIPAYIPNKGLPEMKNEMRDNLGVTVEDSLDPTGYTQLAQCLLQNTTDSSSGTCPFTWGYDNGWIDLDDWVYPYFHTGGTKNSFLVSDSKLDGMIEDQRKEFTREKRQQTGYDIQKYLLDSVLARLDYVAPINRTLQWNYVKNQFIATWFGHNYLYANVWLNTQAPSFQGRPA